MRANWGLIMGAVASLAVIGGAVVLLRRRQEQSIPVYAGGSPGFYTGGGMPVLKREEPPQQQQPTDYLSDFKRINPQPMPVLIPKSEYPQPAETTRVQTGTMPVLISKTSSGLLERVTYPTPIWRQN